MTDQGKWTCREVAVGTMRWMYVMDGERKVCETSLSMKPYDYEALLAIRDEFQSIIDLHNAAKP